MLDSDIIIKAIKDTRIKNKLSKSFIADHTSMSLSSYNSKENMKSKFKITEVIEVLSLLNNNLILDNKVIKSNQDILGLIVSKRKLLGLTQEDIRQQLNFKSLPTYSNKENGKLIFYLDDIVNICKILNIQ